MNLGVTGQNVSFGRAFTTKEQKEYSKVRDQARKELNLDKTIATVFDFSVPTEKHDTGIGTSFSDDGQKLASMLKTMCGVNAIQLQPQGQISNYVRSPYSGTGFSLGEHLIDLTKLTTDNYANLLDESDLDSDYMTRTKKKDTVDYDNVFAKDGQKAMLEKAYAKFAQLPKNAPIKKEFEKFKKENEYWLERDALFEASAESNGSRDIREWSRRDQNVFDTKEGDTARINELKQVKNKSGHNVVDLEEFVQFIAGKQQQESKAAFNKQGTDIYGDCQIGFSQKDFWAHKSAFSKDYEFGCEIGGGNYSCWSPSVDFNKIDGEAGELLYNKFDTFFKRYDGVRIDAAWQLINPTVCRPKQNNGHDVFDNNGNKLGDKLPDQPVVKDNGKHILNNIILKAADNNKVSRDKVFLELLGGNSWDSLNAVKGSGASLIHITRYGGDNWGRVKYYESQGDNRYQNMKPGDYIIGPGTHDDDSLIEQARNAGGRTGYLAYDLRLDKGKLDSSPEERSAAIVAELFTTKNQFATLPDILGSEKRINTPNTVEGNWSYRAPKNVEKEYYTNLAQGKGFNVPDAMSKALKAKKGASSLTEKLDKFAEILKQKGPYTTEEADKAFRANAKKKPLLQFLFG